jgi:hypothetical protein
MIGLRLDNDQVQKKRTYRFAEKLNGRFFVSGVSGSFQKYSKFLQKMEERDEKVEKIEKYVYAPVMERHRKEELKREAQRLMEIEEKLNEVIEYWLFLVMVSFFLIGSPNQNCRFNERKN